MSRRRSTCARRLGADLGTATIKLEPGTQPGDVMVRRGQGIPRVGESSRGDHVVQFKVDIPKKLSARQEELLRELADELGENVKEKRAGCSVARRAEPVPNGSDCTGAAQALVAAVTRFCVSSEGPALALPLDMGIHTLLERMGFVRLRDFGLLLTPDRRILTTRPVLDDGFGATVVGWEGNDLAMMELPTKPGPGAASVVSMAAPKPVPPAPLVMPAATPSMPMPVLAAPIAAPIAAPPIAPAPSPPPVVTQAVTMINPVVSSASSDDAAPEMTEDEWEWEIAMARVRALEASLEEATVEAVAPVLPVVQQPIAAKPRDTRIAPVTSTRVSEPARPANALPRTIIPVPTLPAAVNPQLVIDDVTRQRAMPRYRAARGTDTQLQIANDDTSTAINLRAAPRR